VHHGVYMCDWIHSLADSLKCLGADLSSLERQLGSLSTNIDHSFKNDSLQCMCVCERGEKVGLLQLAILYSLGCTNSFKNE